MKIKKRIAGIIATAMLVSTMSPSVWASDYDSHWAKHAIDSWKDKGILQGFEDGTFRPKELITRAQFAKIMNGIFGYTDIEGAKQYTDVTTGKWYQVDVTKISAAGIMYIEGDNFKPDQPMTREEVAYALANAYGVTGTATGIFKDETQISDWALVSVQALYANGYVHGNPDGSFNPKGLLTRAEMISMIDNLNGELINKKGTYTQDITGNLVVNTRDVMLKDMTISGNLYLTEGIGDGDIELDNITVKGKTFVAGGGVNSIKSRNCKYLENIAVSAKNPVRVVIEGDAVKIEALPGTNVTLTGNFKEIQVASDVKMTIKEATVEKLVITETAKGSGVKPSVEIAAGTTVQTIQADNAVEITGTGKVGELIVQSNDVKIAQKPDKVTIEDKDIKVEVAGKEETKDTPTNGGNSSGSGSSSGNSSQTTLKYTIKGVIKLKSPKDGLVLAKNVKVEVGGPSLSKPQEITTNEKGEYSIQLPAGKEYGVQVMCEDGAHYGYFYYEDEPHILNGDWNHDIEIKPWPVTRFHIVDEKGNGIPSVAIGHKFNGEDYKQYMYTDANGYCTRFLWEEDLKGKIDYYFIANGKTVNPITTVNTITRDDVIKKFGYRYDLKVELKSEDLKPLGDTYTIKGVIKLQSPKDGIVLAKNVKVEVGGPSLSKPQEITTNEKGEYSIQLPAGKEYGVQVMCEDGAHYGYFYYEDEPHILNGDWNHDIEIKPWPVTRFHIVDEKGNGIPSVAIGHKFNGEDYKQYMYTDANGYCTRFLWEEDLKGKIDYYFLIDNKEVKPITAVNTITRQEVIQKHGYNYALEVQFLIGEPESTEKKHNISGTVKAKLADGTEDVVEGAEVAITEMSVEGVEIYSYFTTTDENGDYSYQVPGNKIYKVEANVITGDGPNAKDTANGYYYGDETGRYLSSDWNHEEVIMTPFPISIMHVVDENGKGIPRVKVIESGLALETNNYGMTDNYGYLINYVRGSEMPAPDFYLGTTKVEPQNEVPTVSREEIIENNNRYVNTAKLSLNSAGDFSGTVYKDGNPVGGVGVFLNKEIIKDIWNTEWKGNVGEPELTNAEGTFTFENLEALAEDELYTVGLGYREADQANGEPGNSYDAIYDSCGLYTVKANGRIDLEQSYGVIVTVLDKEGMPLKDVHLTLSGSHNGEWNYEEAYDTDDNGIADIHSLNIVPGINTITASYEVDGKSYNKIISVNDKDGIVAGKYNYRETISLDDIVGKGKPVEIKLTGNNVATTGSSIQVAKVGILTDNDGCWRDVDNTKFQQEFYFRLPEGFTDNLDSNTLRLCAIGENGEQLYVKPLESTALGYSEEIDFRSVPHSIISGSVLRVKDNQCIQTTGAMLKVYMLGWSDKENKLLVEQNLEGSSYSIGDLPTAGDYLLEVTYMDEEGNQFTRKQCIGNLGNISAEDLAQFTLFLGKEETVTLKFQDEAGNPLANWPLRIEGEKYSTDSDGIVTYSNGNGVIKFSEGDETVDFNLDIYVDTVWKGEGLSEYQVISVNDQVGNRLLIEEGMTGTIIVKVKGK